MDQRDDVFVGAVAGGTGGVVGTALAGVSGFSVLTLVGAAVAGGTAAFVAYTLHDRFAR